MYGEEPVCSRQNSIMDTVAGIPFKALVIGAGVTGLIMSHALHRAGIDRGVLEARQDVVYPAGGSFGLLPSAARILDQMGCWQQLNRMCSPLEHSYKRRPDGLAIKSSKLFEKLAAWWISRSMRFTLNYIFVPDLELNYGYEFLVLERQSYIRVLYESLPDQTLALTGKRVASISDNDDNITVHLEDGPCEEGDLVIGCDGVHSTVRAIMWENANKALPGMISASGARGCADVTRS